ncbi:MAG: RHS repeat-associated core domain-containing protein [Sediminicola sp.]
MKNSILYIICIFGINLGISQDSLICKSVKASKVSKTTVNLEGALSEMSYEVSGESTNSVAMTGGTVNGGTVGALSVSASGAAVYEIPIDVPPGINGVQPAISLSFNSQSGNGLAGWGWNVTGISIITRAPSTLFHDSQMDPVDFDLEDRFSFDGQRLILKTGTYGTDGAVYQTENNSNVKIISYGSHPIPGISGPQHFKVFYPDGSIALYGLNNDSRSRTDYAISYWENPQGVRVNYVYNISQNSLSINKITYGSRGTAASTNEIQFIYGTRARAEQSYMNGTSFIRNTILTEINTKGNGQAYRNVRLTYNQTSLGYDRLRGVQELTGDNSLSRSSIIFNYGSSSSGIEKVDQEFGELTVQNIEQRNAEVVTMDMSGDGRMDFIVYPTTGTDTKKKFWFFDSNSSFGGYNFGTVVNTGPFIDVFPVTWLNNDYKMLSNQGLAVVQNSGSYQVRFKVYSSGGAIQPIAFKYEKIWNAPKYVQIPYCGADPDEYRIPLQYVSGDFDGDGLSDVMAIEKPYTYSYCTVPEQPCENGIQPLQKDQNQIAALDEPIDPDCCDCSVYNNNSSRVHLVKLDRRLPTNFGSPKGFLTTTLQSSDRLYTMDVNGDGKTDILQFREGKVYVYSLNSANSSLQLLWETTDSRIKMDHPILPGDYNGDGKSDFMIATADNSSTFVVFLSGGNNFIPFQKAQPFVYKETDYNGQGTLYGYNLVPVDINGDGRTDIIDYRTVTYNSSSSGTQSINLYENRQSTYANNGPLFTTSGSTSNTGNLKHFPIPIFLTSDRPNSNLEFASISDKWVTAFEFDKDHREDVSLYQILNKGITTNIKYDQINPYYEDGNDPYYFSAYTPGYDQIYPFVDIQVAPSFKVVRELEQTGSALERNKIFYYEGAVSHALGLGFVGFETLKQTNWYGDDVGVVWNISKQDPSLRGAVTQKWTSLISSSTPGQYIEKTDYFYDQFLVANPGSPTAPEYPDNLTRSWSIPGLQKDEAEQYISLMPGFQANGANGTYWAKIIPPGEQPGDSGYAGVFDVRLNRMEHENTLIGVATVETYTYDGYNNPLTVHTTFPGGSKTITSQYTNNPGSVNNTYHIGRLIGKTEQTTLSSSTFSGEEQYSYNNNLVSQLKKRGNGTSWLTEDFQYDVNGNIVIKTLNGEGVSPRTEEFTYGYGGRFLTSSKDIEGLVSTFTYDAATGNLLTTTNPYNLTTTYEYDKWNRIKKETDYLNKSKNHLYTNQADGGMEHRVDYADGGSQLTKYNAFGWTVRVATLSLGNQWAFKDIEYYADGKSKRQSEPHYSSPSQWSDTNYDSYGRMDSQTLFTGRNISVTYSGLSTTVNDGVKSVTTTLDALGNKVKVQDPGGTVDYTYFANGTMKSADYGGNVITVAIDGWGRKTSLNDPSAGTYTYSYNSFGELLEETTPKGSSVYEYDSFGKVLSKDVIGDLTDQVLTYQYDNVTKLLTNINGQDNTNNRTYTYVYTYDTYKRPATVKENSGLAEFEHRWAYDTYGRVDKETLISKNLSNAISKNVVTRNVYDSSGILKEIWNDGTPDKLWEMGQVNARGQALSIVLGNGITKTKNYDAYGYLTKIEDKENGTNPTVALHMEYSFNQQRGTLNSRENIGFGWQESFGYDNLDRLTTISGAVAKTMAFDTRGRITNNTALGTYSYGNTNKKYQLTGIDPNTAGETYYEAHPAQQITYNSFKKPVDIHEEGHGRASFEYGPLMNRSTAYYGGAAEDKLQRRYRKHYSAIIPAEIVEDTQTGSTKILTYVGGDAYTAPIVHIKKTGTGALDEYHYLHRDYLGSILAITDADGDVREELHFGAWGTVDRFLDSTGNTIFGHGSLLGRGYTGHEHFFEVSLIHMNGRMYDAQLGRFLSPDNFVQDPFNTQNFNRYGYVLNNPLMYNDASGEFFWFAVGIGALVGAISQAIKPGANFGSIVGGALIGGAAGMIGAGVGSWAAGGGFFTAPISSSLGFGAGFVSGFAGGFAGGFVGTVGSSWLDGANFGNGLGKGLKDGLFGGLTGGLVNGINSGIRANRKGLGFFSGIAKPKGSLSPTGSGLALGKKIPSVYAEGDYLDWTGTAAGPDGNSVFRTGMASMEYTYRFSNTSIDWGTTLRVNGSEIGGLLQNVGDGMAVAGYGLTLSVVGAEIGVPLAAAGNGISFGGSMLESTVNLNWSQGTKSLGFLALDKGSSILIRRIPGTTILTRQILEQNSSLKINLIEKIVKGN